MRIIKILSMGVMHDGEPSFFMRFSAADPSYEDIVAVISYLRTIKPARTEVPPGE